MLEDIAILTGGQVVSEDLGIKLENIQISDLGKDEILENEILSVGDRSQFSQANQGDLLERLTGSHPCVRTYSDCFGHCMAIEGAVGAMVDPDLEVAGISEKGKGCAGSRPVKAGQVERSGRKSEIQSENRCRACGL